MTRFRRLAVGAALAGTLTVTGLAAAAAPAGAAAAGQGGQTVSSAPRMWLQYGPYESLEVCDIVRILHGPVTSQCNWRFYDWAHFGWYFGSDH